MSFSYREGKDEVHFITKDDVENYNKEVEQQVNPDVHEQYPGAVSETGEINWECPCLGGLGTEGPCVPEFRSAFSCWMFSDAEKSGGEKGDDCVDDFFAMSLCMQANEEFYNDLSAKNKAAAVDAQVKWEEEERKMVEEAETAQKAIESESDVKAIESESESESESDVKAIESESDVKAIESESVATPEVENAPEQPPAEAEEPPAEPEPEQPPAEPLVEPEPTVEPAAILPHTMSLEGLLGLPEYTMSSLPEETFSKAEYSSAIVAATSTEEEQDAKEEGDASAGS